MIQKESRLDVADNSGAKVTMVIGTKGMSTARGRFTRIAVGVGDRVTCTVKKALPNADIKAGDKVQAVIVRTKYPTRRSDGSYVYEYLTNHEVLKMTHPREYQMPYI